VSGLASKLHLPMTAVDVQLLPLDESHRDGLRAACAQDATIWDIYPYSMTGAHFDAGFDGHFIAGRLAFAIIKAGTIVGSSSYFLDAANAVVEIGGTYVQPDMRGTGLNARIKHMMLARAFDSGIATVRFRVDSRNARSQAALRKLGAQQEGMLRSDRVTWTGYRRDTVVFSILAHEWPEVESLLHAQVS
jgi:RimJ/RimL family protein N-acetyltransferase